MALYIKRPRLDKEGIGRGMPSVVRLWGRVKDFASEFCPSLPLAYSQIKFEYITAVTVQFNGWYELSLFSQAILLKK